MAYTAMPSGFLADVVQRIRDFSDEASDSAKWTTDRLFPLIRRAFARIVHDVNAMSSGPICVRYDLAVTPSTQTYYLPANVGEIWRFGWVDATNGYVTDAVTPDSRLNPAGPGIIFEGPTVRFEPFWQNSETLRIEYIPNGDCQLHLGTFAHSDTGVSASGFRLSRSPSEGYFDARPNAYLGCLVRVISTTATAPYGSYAYWPIQERIVTGYDSTTGAITVTPDFDLNAASYAGTYTYELVPMLGDKFVQAVALRVAHEIHAFEGRADKMNMVHKLFIDEMKTVKSELNNLNARTGNRFHGDVPGSGRFGMSIGWGMY